MTKPRFRAAAVQTLARLGDLDYNLELVEHYTREAVRQGAELIVFPECMNTGYLFDSAEHAAKLAEPIDGRFVQALGRLARLHGVYLASGMTESSPSQGKLFNTGVLLDRRGELVGHYHKQFLATHDQNWFAFGINGCPVVDTDLGRLGMLICFDGRIPEIARCLALLGAEVLVDMANFFAMDQAEMWAPARAFENGVWLVASTKAGYERSIYYPGGSMVVDPGGRVRARMPYDRHGVIVEDVFPAEARAKQIYADNDRLGDRRPECYEALVRPYDATPVARLHREPLVPSDSVSKIAAVQAHVSPEMGTDQVVAMLSHAAKLGINIMTLPEYAFVPEWCPDSSAAARHADEAESVMAAVAGICRQYGCAVAVPHVAREAGELYPCCTLVGPDGDTVGRYRKVHLSAEERVWARAGDEFPVFETPFGRVGLMLGYDGLFPEAARCLGVGGADIVLWSACLRHPLERRWLSVTRAADNRMGLVLANRLDAPFPGGSMVVPPTGFPHWDVDVNVPPNRVNGAVMPAFLDLAVCRQKQMIPKVDMFANRLTDTYGPLVSTERSARLAVQPPD